MMLEANARSRAASRFSEGFDPEEGRPSRTLLLQGPIGPLFRLLDHEMTSRGVEVWRINLNLSDMMDWGFGRASKRAVAYRGRRETWPAFLEAFLRDKRIETICLFDDCRPYHREAIAIASKLGISVQVIEAGYFRPDHITVEPDGVQANSRLPRNPEFYRAQADERPEPWIPIGSTFGSLAWHATCYFLVLWISSFIFPHYRHHKAMPWYREGVCAIRSWYRGLRERAHDHAVTTSVVGRQPYFVVPLQVYRDQQITRHSDYSDVSDFILEVIISFADHASPDHHLVLKHHPMDRGYRNYGALIRDRAEVLGCSSRVHYVVDAHLPTLLRSALGTITINSTAGLASLHHGTPVVVMGRSFYAMDGLAKAGGLDQFWHNPGKVDTELYRKFRAFLLKHRQVNGSLYGAFRKTGTASLIADILTGSYKVWSTNEHRLHAQGEPVGQCFPGLDKVATVRIIKEEDALVLSSPDNDHRPDVPVAS
jgi:capsule polysaccharide modification protein KpsS